VTVRDVQKHTHHRVEHLVLDGDVDAAVGVVTNGAELEREYDRQADELLIGNYLDVYGMTVVTNPGFAASNPETVRAFLRATARGWEAATNDPDRAIDALIARNAQLEHNREVEHMKFLASAEDLQFTEFVREAGWGHHDGSRWANLGETLAETDLLESAVDPDDAWTNEYLDDGDPVIANYADRIGR
jgi:NitT/TauT family transport system substrate-binding protein